MKYETSLSYEELKLPNYRNTREITRVGNISITVTDAVIAAVLGGLNILLVGDTGTGKTQLASDIYNHYFGGNKNGIWFKARPDTEIADVFVRLDKEAARKKLDKENVEKLCFVVDEINRAPGPVQDQFLGLGDSNLETPDGKQIQLGKNNYSILIATANISNGEFTGTFEMDKALLNRLHITFDLDFYKRTPEDDFAVNKEGKANPNVRIANARDLSEKILEAYDQISKIAEEPGIEAEVALNCIGLGLDYCRIQGAKTRTWPLSCPECQYSGRLCEKVRGATPRTRRAILKYAAALQYLAGLKAEHEGKEPADIDPFDLIFEAFKIASAYHGILNPSILRADYHEENARMMVDVVKELKEEFSKVRNYVELSIGMAEEFGEVTTQFFMDENGLRMPLNKRFLEEVVKRKTGLKGQKLQKEVDQVYEKIIRRGNIIEPFRNQDDKHSISLTWFPLLLELYVKNSNHDKK